MNGNILRELKLALKALADTSRLEMVSHLADGREVTVTDLAVALHISQPLLSWHLRSLKKAGLVNTRREGRVVHCSLNLKQLAWCQQQIAMLAGNQARVLASG